MSVINRNPYAVSAFQGLFVDSPVVPIKSKRNPTINDKAPLGTIWLNTVSNGAFILVSIISNVATWVSIIGGSSALQTLTGDSGGAVGPTMNNISLLGSGSIAVAGNPGTSTLTISNTPSSNIASFSAYLSSTQNNVTGDGTAYTIIYDTVLYNNGSAYNNGTGVFTAPQTGLYYFQSQVVFSDTVGITNTNLSLVTTNKTYASHGSLTWVESGSSRAAMYYSVICEMSAGDTASFVLTFSGGTKIVDVIGDATNPYTAFTGYFIG